MRRCWRIRCKVCQGFWFLPANAIAATAKEEEVLQSQTALDNLQSCLEAFQVSSPRKAASMARSTHCVAQATRDAEAEMHVRCVAWISQLLRADCCPTQ